MDAIRIVSFAVENYVAGFPNGYFTVKQVASLLGTNYNKAYKLVCDRELKAQLSNGKSSKKPSILLRQKDVFDLVRELKGAAKK